MFNSPNILFCPSSNVMSRIFDTLAGIANCFKLFMDQCHVILASQLIEVKITDRVIVMCSLLLHNDKIFDNQSFRGSTNNSLVYLVHHMIVSGLILDRTLISNYQMKTTEVCCFVK